MTSIYKTVLSMICMLFFFPISSDELRILYQKNHVAAATDYEEELILHVKMSLEKALRLESKLTGKQFEEPLCSRKWRVNFIPHYHSLNRIVDYPGYHLMNNLCALPGASHLHIGLLAGDSFISALYGNQSTLKQQIGVDWFKECPEDIFRFNCHQYLSEDKFQIINSQCFEVEKRIFNQPIDIYFYDADHRLKAHEMALTYFHPIFSDVFVVMIDDWSCPWIRGATFKAFDKLKYSILYENVIMNLKIDDNGQYVAVIRKHEDNNIPQESSKEFLHNYKFTALKNKVFKVVQNSWCTEEKADLIMELIFQARPEICVEVGTFTGSSFLPIVSTLSWLGHGHAYAIDAWSNSEAVKGIPTVDSHFKWWSSVNMEAVYASFLNAMDNAAFKSYYSVIRSPSSEAVEQFDRIDFLHLDGSFSEEGALEDVLLYLPKVVPGGHILLSNMLLTFNRQYPKMKALYALLDQCEIIAEVDQSQTILFKK